MISIPDNKTIRSLMALLTASAIGAVLTILATKTFLPNFDPTDNFHRFLDPLMPMVVGGTALTMVGTFLYSVVSLANEKDREARRWIIWSVVILIVLAYLTSYSIFNMNPGGID